MAEPNVELQQSTNTGEEAPVQEKLKYLDFVHLVALQALVCLSRLYDFAKENSGPLKPGVLAVEGTVKTVVAPVYEKLQDVPYDLLKFVDRKVGDAVDELERHVPALVRQACAVAQKAPDVARSLASEMQRAGLVETATGLAKSAVAKYEPTAKELYAKYEPVAEHYAVSTWQLLNRLPLFPQVAQIVVPTAAYWLEKYNGVVSYGREKGYVVATYLPQVPVERIAKVIGSPNANDVPAQEGAAAAAAAAE